MNRALMSAVRLSAIALCALAGSTLVCPSAAFAQDPPPAPPPKGEGEPKKDFPPFTEISKDFVKVVSTSDGESTMYTVYTRQKDQQVLIELPREFSRLKYMFAMTVSTGEPFAGLQGPDVYVYWKRFDKRLALIEPQITVRSTDAESKVGVDRVFTDRVLLDVPILCIGPGGGPVVDADALFAGQAGRFFGPAANGANTALATIKKAKAFPNNVELAIEMPVANGTIKTFYYSLALVPDGGGYQPRLADERIGYFQTWFRDLGKFKDEEKWVRYINRWHLEKADPGRKVSPPKKPIVFYVEHTVPVRYRRFVRDGALYWNAAFEKIGIVDAIEVYFQDKASGTHMDKDPEDARYNFLRWVTNDIATAIGPSRAHPLTGQILDADIVLTDGWIRAFWFQANELIPDMMTRGMSDQELAFFDANPMWDPRVRMAPLADREAMIAKRSIDRAARLGEAVAEHIEQSSTTRGVQRFGGIASTGEDNALRALGFTPRKQPNALDCMAAQGKAFDMSVSRMALELMDLITDEPETPKDNGDKPKDDGDKPKDDDKKSDKKKDEKKKDDKKEDKPDLLDGIPEWFVGKALADLTAHEVGHTLGLRHNFKASSAYTRAQVNSLDFKGKKPFSTSVMDYNPVNINLDKALVQGDYNQLNIGPYDLWAIEYGYTNGDPVKVAQRAAEPELQYGSDEDAGGIDASIRRYDLFADPLEYAQQRFDLAKYSRARIIEKFVKDGQSWAKARRGYVLTLNMQADAMSIMSNWVGSAYVRRDRKGDPNGRPPLEVVPAKQQRAALAFVLDTGFKDESFGLTTELLKYLTIDRFEDPGAGRGSPDWAVNDQIGGVQASVLSQLINPVRLARIYDNETRVPQGEDALTLPEMLDAVTDSIFTELKDLSGGSARKPSISSLRRNLQRELIDRLITIVVESNIPGAAGKAITSLSAGELRELRGRMEPYIKSGGNLDPYTKAHLADAAKRIDKALDAQYTYNGGGGGGGGGFPFFMFMKDGQLQGMPGGVNGGMPRSNIPASKPSGDSHGNP